MRLAKIRWRIEHVYRELKHGLELDHFEVRSYLGCTPCHGGPSVPHDTETGPQGPLSAMCATNPANSLMPYQLTKHC